MTDAPAEITALEALEALELGIKATRASIQWQIAGRCLPPGAPPTLWQRCAAFAVENDDAAREALNKLRVFLGGEPEPDPADPPPVRPDD
jgi:hypothetical protein